MYYSIITIGYFNYFLYLWHVSKQKNFHPKNVNRHVPITCGCIYKHIVKILVDRLYALGPNYRFHAVENSALRARQLRR